MLLSVCICQRQLSTSAMPISHAGTRGMFRSNWESDGIGTVNVHGNHQCQCDGSLSTAHVPGARHFGFKVMYPIGNEGSNLTSLV